MQKFTLITFGVLIGLLSACGRSVPNLIELNDILNSHELTSFTVLGTGADTASGQASINPGINNGEFHITWSVNDLVQNTVKLVVSNDSNLSDDDVEIYFSLCNQAVPCGQAQVDMLCTISTTNLLTCGFGLISQETPLTEFLDTIPKNAFIIIESCFNANPLLCDSRGKSVQFQ